MTHLDDMSLVSQMMPVRHWRSTQLIQFVLVTSTSSHTQSLVLIRLLFLPLIIILDTLSCWLGPYLADEQHTQQTCSISPTTATDTGIIHQSHISTTFSSTVQQSFLLRTCEASRFDSNRPSDSIRFERDWPIQEFSNRIGRACSFVRRKLSQTNQTINGA